MNTGSPTGERQFLSSLNDWLVANVPAGTDFNYAFLQQGDPANLSKPLVEVSLFNYQEPGQTALGDMIFPENPGGKTQGFFNQAIVAIDIRADGTQQTNALELVGQIKDGFDYALRNAGMYQESTNSIPLPPIYVKLANGSSSNTVARLMNEMDNAILKNFYPPSSNQPQIYRYQLLCRMEWVELSN